MPNALRIWNRQHDDPPPTAVYVGRPSPWGNPFRMNRPSERDRVCEQFETYAINRAHREPEWLAPLAGKDLVCWCAPQRCHAETLLRLANPAPDA